MLFSSYKDNCVRFQMFLYQYFSILQFYNEFNAMTTLPNMHVCS